MDKNTKTNLFLFAGLLAAIAVLYTFNKAQNRESAIFLPVDLEMLSHIIIEQTPQIELKKTAGEWNILSPVQGRANPETMQKMFETLAAPLGEKYSLSEVDLKTLSLNPPNLRVLLDEEALDFGRLAATTQMHYVKYQDSVYLASPFLQVRFSQSPQQFLMQPEDDETALSESHGEHH